MRWMVRGDVDGFFGLALDNLVQLLVIDALCRFVLGYPPELVHGRILPGAALSVLAGNLFYAWQAKRLAAREGRSDVCALPYGINTVSLFGHVFFVMLPAKLSAEAAGHPDPVRFSFQAGLAACLGSALLELGASVVAERIRKATPRAALLSTLSGIALGFIALGFLFRTFAHPLVGLPSLGIVLLTYFGRVRFKGGLPGGLVAVLVGAGIAWASGLAPSGPAPGAPSLHLPSPVLGELATALSTNHLLAFAPVIVPMGLFNVLGSLQNIESAEAAGDRYETLPSLAVNGAGSAVAALFGSCFPTTIYIGHPGWKAMGARAGYSVLNGVFLTAVCLSGTLAHLAYAVPIDAGMAIVLWIGIVITAQAFQACPPEEAPAVAVGLLPGVGAWGTLLAKNGLRAGGVGTPGGKPFSEALIPEFQKTDTWIHGAFALEQGFIFTSMILAATTVAIIRRKFREGAVWCALGAGLSLTGVVHSYAFTPGDTTIRVAPAWPFAIGWAAVALLLAVAPLVTEEGGEHGG